MEQHQQHQPRLCQEAEFMKVVRPGPTDSPPPNCAICLGICTNKCFTDCCLHQFCFSCLLEWSKIKAECPLCKQPFKSIIYNIKSNLEYEEHIITNTEREAQGEDLLLDDDIDVRTEYLFLPNGPRPQRHFQYRTTFTLEPGGEFAIQQLLLSHPRTNSIYLHSDRYLHHRLSPHSISQRRNVYTQGLWVDPSHPDITGRYRECTPSFFRENPAQIHRIVPWLNRELSALLVDYLDIYQVQERIMEMLVQYSIQSASFRSRIVSYLGNRTDQFIHEFYNFVRSPFDMIGYDRHTTYSPQQPVVYSHSVSDDDSDVRVVDSPANDDCIYIPPRTPEVIVINSDSSDSDIVMRTPSPRTSPPVVNLIDSESDDNITVSSRQPVQENHERIETSRSPQLPIKIRYKRNRNSAEIINKKQIKKGKMKWYDTDSNSDSDRPKSDSEYSTAHITSSSSSSSSESSSSSSSSNKKYVQSLILKRVKSKPRKRKYSYKSYKTNKYRSKKETTPERSYKIKKKKSSKQKKSKRRNSESNHHHKSKKMKRIKMERSSSSDSSTDDETYYNRKKPMYDIKTERNYSSSEHETKNEPTEFETSPECDQPQDLDVAGPSQGPNLRSVIVRGENKWYSRPELEDTTTDNNSD